MSSYKINLYKKYKELKKVWEEETMLMSSLEAMVDNDIYRQILSIGEDLIDSLGYELVHNPSWLEILLLSDIKKENPIPEEHKGKFKEMCQDWIDHLS